MFPFVVSNVREEVVPNDISCRKHGGLARSVVLIGLDIAFLDLDTELFQPEVLDQSLTTDGDKEAFALDRLRL